MKHTLIALTIALSLILTPLEGIHAATPTTSNTELIQKLLAQIELLQAELQKLIAARGGNTTTDTTTPCTFTRTLYLGTQGQDVTCLQTYLKKKGHFNGTATGYYGPQTKDAVYKWQQSTGIVPEPKAIGMFGPRSQETLVKEMQTTPSVTTNTTPSTETPHKTTKGGGDTTPKTKTPKTTDTVTTPQTTVPKTTDTPKTTTPVTTNTTPITTPTPAKTNTTIPQPTSNSTNWATLCAQSGIFVCDNFSDRHTGTIRGGASTAYYSNGNLVFTIPSNSPADAGGEYRQNFPAIGEGQFLAFSYRIKADTVATNLKAPGRKEFILWRGSSSCTDLQLVQTHVGNGNPLVTPYTECGSGSFTYKIPKSDYQTNYPDYNCTYHDSKLATTSIPDRCAYTHANQWENFYIEVGVGHLNKPDSSVTMWKKIDGESTWRRYIATTTFTFRGNGKPGEGFEHLMLTVYMTGKDASVSHPEGKVYYDHLIMSTKPFNTDQFLSAAVNPMGGTVPTPSTPASVPSPTTPTPTPATTPPTPVTGTPSISTATTSQTALRDPSTPVTPSTPNIPQATGQANTLAQQLASVPAGTWTNISADNLVTDVDPDKDPILNKNYPNRGPWNGNSGFKALFGSWNSGDFASSLGPCGSILYFGGGHQDYYGNEVIALNLCGGKVGGPLWQRLTDPYAEKIVWPAVDGAFPDGTPSPGHTYDELTVANNKLMIFGAQSSNLPVGESVLFIFDLSTKSWTGPFRFKGAFHGFTAWDTKRNVVWFMPETGGSGEFGSYNTSNGEFKYYGKVSQNPLINRLDAMMSYDPVNDLIVTTSFRTAPFNIGEKNPNTPTAPWVAANQINKPEKLAGQHAFEWSPLRKAWIVWMDVLNDGKVWEVKRTGVSATGTPEYTWTLLTSAGNTSIPSTVAHNGGYGKHQLVNVGGNEVLIGTLGVQSGIWAFKIPSPDVSSRPTNVQLSSGGSKTTLEALLKQLQALQAELKKLKK